MSRLYQLPLVLLQGGSGTSSEAVYGVPKTIWLCLLIAISPLVKKVAIASMLRALSSHLRALTDVQYVPCQDDFMAMASRNSFTLAICKCP